jgi:LAO/AO transport system kinase
VARQRDRHLALSEAKGPNPGAPADHWEQPVQLTVAVKDEGIAELVESLDRHHEWLASSGELERRRRRRLLERTREVVDRATRKWVWEETRAEQLINERLDEVAGGRISPYELAQDVLEELRQGERI